MNWSKINQEIQDFQIKNIMIVPGLFFNQKETLETIYFYHNSKFRSGEVDADGDRKFFFNIVNNPCKIYSKSIDIDTKHINILTSEGQDELKAWFFERDLKFWMKDKQFGKVLNRILEELPIYGSCVLKIINNVPYFVDLRNFYVSQSADTLDDSYFITEIHRYNKNQFVKIGKELEWENIEKTIKAFEANKKKQYIDVWERYGWDEEYNENDKLVSNYKRSYVADVSVDEFDYNTNKVIPKQGVILKDEKIDEHPYREFHLHKIPGRWLGVGVIETLIEPQIRLNEIVNLESKGSYWSALRIFQTRDNTIKRNMLTNVANGEVVNSDSEITPINMTDPNLAYFAEQTRKWLQNRDELSLSYDVIQGERLPSGTPLGSARLAASMAMSHFDQVRENIALDIKEFLYEVILPNFEKEATPEHIVRIAGEDLDLLRKMIVAQKATNALFKFIITNRKVPDKTQYDLLKSAIEERVNSKKEILEKIPKGFYKELKYAIDIVITGESKDTSVYTQTLFAALQAITADPTLLQDPNKRKMFYKILDAGGVNPSDILVEQKSGMNEVEMMMGNKGAGGGVSRPFPNFNASQTKESIV